MDPGSPMLSEREELVLSLLRAARQEQQMNAGAERPERRAALDQARSALSGPDREPDDLCHRERCPAGRCKRAG